MSWSIGPCPTLFGSLRNLDAMGIVIAEIVQGLKERDSHARANGSWGGGPPFNWSGAGSDDVRDITVPTIASTDYDRLDITFGKAGSEFDVTDLRLVRKWFDEGGPWGFATPDYKTGWGDAANPRWGSLSDFLTYALGYPAWKADAWTDRGDVSTRAIEELRLCLEALEYAQTSHAIGGSFDGYGYDSFVGTGATPTLAFDDWDANKVLIQTLTNSQSGSYMRWNDLGANYDCRSFLSGAHPSLKRTSHTMPLSRSPKLAFSLPCRSLSWLDGPWDVEVYISELVYPAGSAMYNWGGWSLGASDVAAGGDGTEWKGLTYEWIGGGPRTVYFQFRGSDVLPASPAIPMPATPYLPRAFVDQTWEIWEYGAYNYGTP